jgi:N-acetylglucosamine kinase-like BadF-type ATPase
MTYLLGVDGGTTKTIALLAQQNGRVLGAARGKGSNWTGEDVEIPMQVVIDTVRQALNHADLKGSDIAVGVFTLAGADWLEDHTSRQAVLQAAGICQRVIVKNDSFGGLRAGTDKPYGMVIAAGTGMNAAAIAPDGREWAFGYYETYGGAKDVVREAYVALMRAEDGRGQPTLLTGLVLQKLGFPSVEMLLRAYALGKIGHGEMLSLCPLVFEAAMLGDAIAAEIIVKQGEALAEYVTAMTKRFEMQDMQFDVVLAGSVFKGEGTLLMDTITHFVHQVAPRADIVKAGFEPAVGSLLLAFDAAGLPTGAEVLANLKSTLPDGNFYDTKGVDL